MATIADYGFEVFAPRQTARRGLLKGRRLRSPLGIYTSPLLLLVAWEALCSTGVLSSTLAASPAQVLSAGVHLWSHGEPSTLSADLRISLMGGGVGVGGGGGRGGGGGGPRAAARRRG